MNPHYEKDIQLQILKYFRAIGAYAGKVKTMGRYDQRKRRYIFDAYLMRGMPDLLCFWKNTLFFIEVKAEKGILSNDQTKFQSLCDAAGVKYIVARSMDEVMSVIY